MEILFQILVIAASLIGFIVSSYIFHKKNKKTPVVCFIGHQCDTVIHSDYSTFLKIRLEIWGMLYYSFIFILFSLSLFYPFLILDWVLILSSFAFLFSAYLTYVQFVILKNLCTYCLISAGATCLIVIFEMFLKLI